VNRETNIEYRTRNIEFRRTIHCLFILSLSKDRLPIYFETDLIDFPYLTILKEKEGLISGFLTTRHNLQSSARKSFLHIAPPPIQHFRGNVFQLPIDVGPTLLVLLHAPFMFFLDFI